MHTSNKDFFLEVLINGKPVTEYPYQDEYFIEGAFNKEFTLRVSKTHSGRRTLAVISVDGLSIMSGKPASSEDGGYILDAGRSSIDIPGWRLNNSEVASFYFAALPEAYAAQMGKPQNIGVIGAIFYDEEQVKMTPVLGSVPAPLSSPPPQSAPAPLSSPPPQSAPPPFSIPPNEVGSMSPGAPAPQVSRQRAPAKPGLGTGFGRKQDHAITRVSFTRDYTTEQRIVLRYDTRENLEARGIIIRPSGDSVMQANPFPADEPGCQPPSGWRG